MSLLTSLSFQFSTLGQFWQEKINGQLLRWNIFIILLQLALLLFKFNNLPEQVPLYYSLPWGESQLASVSALFLLPTLSIVIMLLNNLLAALFLNTLKFLSQLLVVFALLFSVLAFITLFQIINLIA